MCVSSVGILYQSYHNAEWDQQNGACEVINIYLYLKLGGVRIILWDYLSSPRLCSRTPHPECAQQRRKTFCDKSYYDSEVCVIPKAQVKTIHNLHLSYGCAEGVFRVRSLTTVDFFVL